MIWLGDFNCHHPMWEDETNEHLFKPDEYIQPLLELLFRHDMVMALPKGLPTFQTVTQNWMRPDNVWHSNNQNNPITRCDIVPAIRPPQADHLPIVTILDLPVSRSTKQPGRNFRKADWPAIWDRLKLLLDEKLPASRIKTEVEFNNTVSSFTDIITEVLNYEIPITEPSPFSRRWWTKELTQLKRKQNRLSYNSYKFRLILDHPSHAEYKAAVREF
jgi:hypothetical protein